jgi:6-pyruvoyltetrahydropterin/6-carboxytetrahydropterin synthase
MDDKGLDDLGRVMDFSVIKEKLCMWLEDHWDHKFIIWAEDPWAKQLAEMDSATVWVDFNPTAENMAKFLVEMVGPLQLRGTGVTLTHVRIEETRKCSATFKLEKK